LTEDLLNVLAKNPKLQVTSRTSAFSFKDTKTDIKTIAEKLNVTHVLEGSVRKAGNDLRITAQLIEVATDSDLWSQTYDRHMENIFALQDDIAASVARALKVTLEEGQTPKAREHMRRTRTLNPLAYEEYLKGAAAEDPFESIQHYEKSVQMDPNFAPSFAGMTDPYFMLGLFGVLPPAEAFGKMKQAAEKAMELDDSLAKAYGALASAKMLYDWNWSEANKEFEHALELNPNDANVHHMYAHFLITTDRPEQAVDHTKKALQLDPLDSDLTACVAWHYLYARNFDESRTWGLKALQLDPNDWWAHMNLGWAYEQKSMLKEAIGEFQTCVSQWPDASLSMASLGHAHGQAGNTGKAHEALSGLLKRAKQNYVSAYDIAILYSAMKDRDHAFEWLEKAYTERSGFLVYIKWDPRLDILHGDPRFENLMDRLGLIRPKL
jgi:tetratricopeptide (TPR) repeat protein